MAVLIKNKKATFNYEILDTFDSGIVLFGFETKSVRNGNGKLDGGHIIVRGGEAFLVGASIAPFQVKNTPKEYLTERPRKLLLTQKELKELIGIESTKGLTLVPISLYNKGRYIKLQFASVKGKKKADKRESIKERDSKRDIDRVMKEKNR
jgi:SsrA-binding protein